MKTITVELTFTEEVLGMAPADPEIYKAYIATKNPDGPSRSEKIAQEIQSVSETSDDPEQEVVEKSMTIFPRANGKPIAYDYQLKGFFKDICGALQKMKGEEIAKESAKIKAYKKVIDGVIMVYPRQIPITVNGEMGICQRPLRAETAQGSRIALAVSETIPAGSKMTFEVQTPDAYAPVVYEWLNYGQYKGFGQWRNSGKGRFYVKTKEAKGMAKMR